MDHICATNMCYKYAQYMVRIRHLYARQFRLSYMLHIRDISGVSFTQHPGDHTLYDLKKYSSVTPIKFIGLASAGFKT